MVKTYELRVQVRDIKYILAIAWTIILLSLQIIFFSDYEGHQKLLLFSNENIGRLIPLIGLFGLGETSAIFILDKRKFVKFNALYTFILTMILTLGVAIMISAKVSSFHILYFLSYLFEENGVAHIPFYNFLSTIYISIITLFSLAIPDKYFGKIKFKRKQLIILIIYFIIISIHF